MFIYLGLEYGNSVHVWNTYHTTSHTKHSVVSRKCGEAFRHTADGSWWRNDTFYDYEVMAHDASQVMSFWYPCSHGYSTLL